MQFALILDKSAGPIRHQIYTQWRQNILNGRFRPGQGVPSSRDLAATLGVARSTVTEAYEQLIAEGYLEAARGSGTFVCARLPEELPKTGKRTAKLRPVRLSDYAQRLTYDYVRASAPPGVITFPTGSPDLRSFPFALWRRMILRESRAARSDLYDYTDHTAGHPDLRREIAAYLSRTRGVSANQEQVLVVNGSQQGLDLCARLLLNPGDEVGFENPGYQGARRIFEAQGAVLRAAPIDAEGIVLTSLPSSLRLVYVTPSHQFPSGVSMSLARRLELLEWARKTGAVILEDDYSSEYRYQGPPLPSLQGLAEDVPVLYAGTFSKILFPGLRIGYVIVPAQLQAVFRRAKWLEDRNTPLLEQKALAEFLREGHLERHVRRMRRLYGKRRQSLVDALKAKFGESVEIPGDSAGMHLIARFASPLAPNARVSVLSTGVYYLDHARRGEYIFGFSGISERSIRDGVRRLELAGANESR